MISKEELDRTILELEAKDTTFANCERLCWLYTVRNNITGQQTAQPTPLDISGDSEFLQAVNGKNSVQVWRVIDELLDVLKITNNKLYSGIILKLSKIDLESKQWPQK